MRESCLCGCGQIPRGDKSRWVRGHHNYSPESQARNHSPEHLAQLAQLRKANFGREHAGTQKATVSPTARDLEWAAGFLEGEGCFRRGSGVRGTEHVQGIQVNREPLERLLRLFGGSIHVQSEGPRGLGRQTCHTWDAWGSRARGIMMTLYSLVTERRKAQIRTALAIR